MDSQAHDALFRESFSQVETVQAYVKNCLPKAISELLDFETFELENGSFLDEELKRYFADVVWKCQLKIGLPLKLTLLFEHKSEYEELEEQRLLAASREKPSSDAIEYARNGLANRLKAAMKKAGWTQADLASKAKIRAETISRIMSRKHTVDVSTWDKIYRALKKSGVTV